MPGSATAVFSKLDDFEAALQTEGSLKLFITARGQLKARLTQVQLYRVRLVAIEETLPIVGYLAVPSHQTLVLFPIADQPSPVWGAVGVRRGEILTLGSSHRVHFRSQGPCAWGSIAFRELDLATCYRDLTEDTLTIPPGVHLWRPRQAHGRRLLQLHSAAIRAAEGRPETIINVEAAHGLEQQLLEAVIECLSEPSHDAITPKVRSHQGLMMKFEEFLQSHPKRYLRAQEVNAAVGVSGRLLRTYCRQDLGMSPTRYVRIRALHNVHRILRDGPPGEVKVSAVARGHGFRDLARFATSYRSLFGELPSATLREGLHQ